MRLTHIVCCLTPLMLLLACADTESDAGGSDSGVGDGDGDGSGDGDGDGSGDGDGDGDGTGDGDGDGDGDGAPTPIPVTTIADLFTPFDVDDEDLVGPDHHATSYGKPPEIIAIPSGAGIDVLAQDHANPDVQRCVLFRLEPTTDDFVVTQTVDFPHLDRVMGLASDDSGDLYVATGIIESLHQEITEEYPGPDEYRSDIVRVLKTDWSGEVMFDTDLDLARLDAAEDPEKLINPMVAATARMAWGNDRLHLMHGINTDPDGNGVRHQKAIATQLDADTGLVTKTSSIWVSHSFDQRVLHDGSGFIEWHLGDAYPRTLAFARVEPDSGSYPLFHIKGDTGANVTRTRLGNIQLIEDDGDYGYLGLFASESTTGTDPIIADISRVAGSRELAIVRVRGDFESTENDQGVHLDPALPDTLDVVSGGENRSNRLRWLTSYHEEAAEGHVNAERPKLVGLGEGSYVVLWERWELEGSDYQFTGTWAMVIDAMGDLLVEPALVDDGHLPRGDDAFSFDGRATWITGDATLRQLEVHWVDSQLNVGSIIVE